MASTIFKLTDYDQDLVHFENYRERIHIRTENVNDECDGVVCSIDKDAAKALIKWLQDTIGPSAYYHTPTLITYDTYDQPTSEE